MRRKPIRRILRGRQTNGRKDVMPEEVVQPRIRGFISINAHPEGCSANVRKQIDFTQTLGVDQRKMNALIIGASTGYGLASRIAAAFGYGADTVGVFYDRPASGRKTASAGYYNSVAFHEVAQEAGLKAGAVNGDGFSDPVKKQVVELLRGEYGKIDLLIHSLAAPRRTHPKTGVTHHSVLKPIGGDFKSKTIDLNTGKVETARIPQASGLEIADTIQVMGGEDFALWVDALLEADLFAEGARAVAFSYIGPEITHAVYRDGTIGMAKLHLEQTTPYLSERLEEAVGGSAYVSVNKAIVSQASAAIPVVPLYISMLYPVMREAGVHETPIMQMNRLLREKLMRDGETETDSEGRIRLDDKELDPNIQREIAARWASVRSDNLVDFADFPGFRRSFRRLFGFDVAGVDYMASTEIDRPL